MSTKCTNNIFLVGFSGSGKSTIGPLLAKRLKVEYGDTDAMIESHLGSAIAEVFADQGQSYFRKLESSLIAELSSASAVVRVVSLGGGAFQSAANRRRLLKSGTVVYLSCPVRELYHRTKMGSVRPLLYANPKAGETAKQAGLRRITELLAKRKEHYRKAHIRISTFGKTPSEVVRQLSDRIKELHAKN